MSLSIDDLRSFILVVRERSVSRAASQLGVTQQSVSERIRRLERRLGVQLFSRLPHGMQPKPAAYRLLPYAQSAVTSVEQALRIVDDDDLIRVIVQPSIAPALTVLDSGLGGARFEVRSEPETDLVMSAVSDGTADVGLGTFTPADVPELDEVLGRYEPDVAENGVVGASPEAEIDGSETDAPESGEPEAVEKRPGKRVMRSVWTPPADVVVEQLFADPVIWVAPPGHPLTSRRGPVSAGEVAELAVGVATSNGTDHAPTSDSGEAEPEPGGVRIAARSTVASALAEGRLVEVSVDLPGWVLPVSIAYRSTDRDRPAIAALRTAIVDEHRRSHEGDLASPPPVGVRP